MISLLKAFDADIDPEQMTKLLSQELHSIESSLDKVITDAAKWPTLPSNEQSTKSQIDLKQYRVAYDTLKILLTPTDEDSQLLNQIMQCRKDSQRAREELKSVMESKTIVGPKVCLQRALILKELLKKQREAENTYFEMMMHKWRTAMTTFSGDLSKAQNSVQNV